MTITLSGLYVYPLKSCAPLPRPAAEVDPRGLAGDRRWMVVDADGRFVTGRQQPRLTLVRACPDGPDALRLDAPDLPTLRLVPAAAERTAVTVWGSRVLALPAEPAADAWISRFLGQPARFVHMDAAATRRIDGGYSEAGEVSFADGFPLLLLSAVAVDLLNARLARPVSPLRFRPNLIVAGTEAHAEDRWKRVRIGEVVFEVVKPCTRCVFTTVDFERGVRDPDGEPLRTLLTYRRGADGVTFGQNLVPLTGGGVRVGDRVDVLD